MKFHLSNFSTIAISAITILTVVQGFDPVRGGDCKGTTTERLVRPHGAYYGLFGGFAIPDVSVGGGFNGFSVDAESTWMIGAEFGYEFNTVHCLRPALEVELSYFDYEFTATNGNALTQGGVEHLNVMFNLILALDMRDCKPCDSFLGKNLPYIGFGIGGSHAEDAFPFSDNSSVNLATQFLIGLEHDLSDCFSLYGELRWMNSDLASGPISEDIHIVNAGIKIRY